MQHVLGGKVEKAPVREYGKTEVFVDTESSLFTDVSKKDDLLDEPFRLYFQSSTGI